MAGDHRDEFIQAANTRAQSGQDNPPYTAEHDGDGGQGTLNAQDLHEVCVHPQYNLGDTNDYAMSQDIDGELALPGYLSTEGDQQDESQVAASSARPSDSFATSLTSSPSTHETRSKRPRDSQSPPNNHRSKKHSSVGDQTSHHIISPAHQTQGGEKRERRRKGKPAGSDAGDGWEWDEERGTYKSWNEVRWEYWNEEHQAREYWDGKKWEWVT